MNVDHAAKLLAETQIFGDLDDASLKKLGERATQRAYDKGQLIFHQGDLAGSLFVMREGLVKVFVTSEAGDEMVFVTLRPPDTFGEVSLLDGRERSASAEAVEPTTVVELDRKTFLEVLDSNPHMTETLLRSMGGVLRRLTEQASDLVFLDLHGRVAKLLLSIADDRGVPLTAGQELDLQLTQSDLARMVGGSRQSVNQILRSFERRGFLDIDGRKVVVKEPEQLRRRAGL